MDFSRYSDFVAFTWPTTLCKCVACLDLLLIMMYHGQNMDAT